MSEAVFLALKYIFILNIVDNYTKIHSAKLRHDHSCSVKLYQFAVIDFA